MSSQPQLLAYAHRDTTALRWPRPVIAWCLLAGGLAVLAIVPDLLLSPPSSQLQRLAESFRNLPRRRWDGLSELAWSLQLVMPCVAGPILFLAVWITRRSGWTISTTSLRLVRTAALLMAVVALANVANIAGWLLNNPPPQRLPMLQLILYVILEAVGPFLTPALLMAMSFRRCHAEPKVVQRVIAVLGLCVGLPVVAVLIDQGWRWALGTPPIWTEPLDPQLAAGMPALNRRIWEVQRLVLPSMQLLQGLLATVVAAVTLFTTRRRRPWFLTLAAVYTVLPIFHVVVTILQAGTGSSYWPRVGFGLLSNAMGLLVPLTAWWSVREGASALPHPE